MKKDTNSMDPLDLIAWGVAHINELTKLKRILNKPSIDPAQSTLDRHARRAQETG